MDTKIDDNDKPIYSYKMIKGYSKKVVDGIKKGAEAIESICEAWQNGVVNAKAN